MIIEVSPQAVDHASNHLRALWLDRRQITYTDGVRCEEGLHGWLRRMAGEALENGDRLSSGKYRFSGIKFEIEPRNGKMILRDVWQVK